METGNNRWGQDLLIRVDCFFARISMSLKHLEVDVINDTWIIIQTRSLECSKYIQCIGKDVEKKVCFRVLFFHLLRSVFNKSHIIPEWIIAVIYGTALFLGVCLYQYGRQRLLGLVSDKLFSIPQDITHKPLAI